jgi:hypothetical protein
VGRNIENTWTVG